MVKRAPRVLFTDIEVAFLLNYADYCLRNGLDYRTTVVAEIKALTGADRQVHVAITKLSKTLKKHVRQSADVKEYLRTGTGYLNLRKLPRSILTSMNQQRKEWGFGLLGDAYTRVGNGKEDTDADATTEDPVGAANPSVSQAHTLSSVYI